MNPDPDLEVSRRTARAAALAAEDAQTISAYRSDPEVHRYQGWERTDPEGVREEIESMAAGRLESPAAGCSSRSRNEGRAGSSVTSA